MIKKLGSIPDEQAFLNSGDVTGLGERQLPPHVTNRVQDAGDGTKAVSLLVFILYLKRQVNHTNPETITRNISSRG